MISSFDFLVSSLFEHLFYPRMALIGTNKINSFAVGLVLYRKIKFTAKYSFVFIRVISGQIFPFI